jgi:hypothetical protein
VLLARQLTALETHIPEVTELSRLRLCTAGLEQVMDYLTELNIGGALYRRCERLARGMTPS